MIIHKQLMMSENLEDCNTAKNRKVLIVFDEMITDMGANKK